MNSSYTYEPGKERRTSASRAINKHYAKPTYNRKVKAERRRKNKAAKKARKHARTH